MRRAPRAVTWTSHHAVPAPKSGAPASPVDPAPVRIEADGHPGRQVRAKRAKGGLNVTKGKKTDRLQKLAGLVQLATAIAKLIELVRRVM